MKISRATLRRLIKEELNLLESIDFFGSEFLEFKNLVEEGENPESVAKTLGFPRIGSGAFRVVYGIPNSDFTLKISKDDNFYNKVEANNSMNTKYSDIFPKVFDAADDFSWILSERVRVITDYIEFLDWFPETGYKFKNTLSSSLRPFWQALKLSVRKLNKKDETYSQENLISGFGKLVKKLNKSILFNRIVSASAEFDIDVEDIDIGNVGVATRDEKDYFVILDASIFKK
jgi:hypothetical protein